MLTYEEERYQRELAEAAEHINDYLQEIPLYRPAHDWLIRNGFEDTSYQNDFFKDLDSGKKNMHQIKEELANIGKQNGQEMTTIEIKEDYLDEIKILAEDFLNNSLGKNINFGVDHPDVLMTIGNRIIETLFPERYKQYFDKLCETVVEEFGKDDK